MNEYFHFKNVGPEGSAPLGWKLSGLGRRGASGAGFFIPREASRIKIF